MGRRLLPPGTLIFLALWLLLLIAGRQTMFRDPGAFWHVAAGREILRTGEVPRADHYSFTRAGRPWVADQWLAEAGMAAAHRAAGWTGLLTLAAALLAATLTLPAVRLLRAGLHWLPTLLLLALMILAGAHQFHVRPLLVTFLFTAVVYAGLIDLEAGRRRWRCAIGLVLLAWLWANLHGGVLGGIGMAGLALGGWSVVWAIQKLIPYPSFLIPHPSSFPALAGGWLLLGLTLLLLLVNPYGAALPKCWIATLDMPLPEIIQEHRPPTWNELSSMAAVILAVLYAATLCGLSPRRLRATWLIPLAWMALGVMRVRFLPLFALTAALALAETLPQSRWAGWLRRRGMLGESADCPGTSWSQHCLPYLIPGILVLAVFVAETIGIGREWAAFDPRIAPEALLEEIEGIAESAPPEGERIFNDLNFGGFLIDHAPRMKIFIDDRCLLYGTDFLRAYDEARREKPEAIEHWRREYGFRYALVEAGGRFDDYLAHSGRWTAQGSTNAAILYRYDLGKTAPQ
ncbi:MAG: hypothetical protein JXB10_19270 [Pirellulales bacterium]|nr:hypothetical protein [Pirellulales bacterium]